MNSIMINEKELNEIMNYEGTHYFENFVFDDFRVIQRHDDYKVVYKIHINGNVNEVNYKIIKGDDFKDCKFVFAETEEDIKVIEFPNGELVDSYISNSIKIGNARSNEEIAMRIIDIYKSEMIFISKLKQYIMNKSYERRTIQKESCSGMIYSSGSNKKTRGKKKITQFLLADIVEYISHSGRKHNINCECWAVRGHFRHYKTGNVVWVSPYEKGKARNTNRIIEGNIYII